MYAASEYARKVYMCTSCRTIVCGSNNLSAVISRDCRACISPSALSVDGVRETDVSLAYRVQKSADRDKLSRDKHLAPRWPSAQIYFLVAKINTRCTLYLKCTVQKNQPTRMDITRVFIFYAILGCRSCVEIYEKYFICLALCCKFIDMWRHGNFYWTFEDISKGLFFKCFYYVKTIYSQICIKFKILKIFFIWKKKTSNYTRSLCITYFIVLKNRSTHQIQFNPIEFDFSSLQASLESLLIIVCLIMWYNILVIVIIRVFKLFDHSLFIYFQTWFKQPTQIFPRIISKLFNMS